MAQRIVSIWFQHLVTDWKIRQEPDLKNRPFVMTMQERNRRMVKAVNNIAHVKGIYVDMVVADAKAIVPELKVLDYVTEQTRKLLATLAEWFIRYTPHVTIDPPDGLLLDVSGCTHLWKGEENYLKEIVRRFNDFGYTVRATMADTAGTAWAVCRFAQRNISVVPPGTEAQALLLLPPAALRIEASVVERLEKLGLTTIAGFMKMPRTALRRRFGQNLLSRMDQALGVEMEHLEPVRPIAPYQEHLPCMEPICTATGIEIALKTLLEMLCQRLNHESKGLRKCELRCYRLDGNIQKIEIGTNAPSRNVIHLFKLFENNISRIEPDLGIELFIIEAPVVETLTAAQDALWTLSCDSEKSLAELQDRLAGKIGKENIQCYVPEERHWPEHSVKKIPSMVKDIIIPWRTDLPRPAHLLLTPEAIEVSVPLPDYPPLMFIHKGTRYNISKADGPERIEQEWWKQQGLYRDYYCVEDDRGERYWLFRLGNYSEGIPKWFIHGFFS
jgi:protein ImuB